MKMISKNWLFAILLCISVCLNANEVEIDGINYKLNDTNATVIPKQPLYWGMISIPETVTYEGVDYSVTQIGNNAFNGCRSLISINMPETITLIGDSAFYNCSGLMSLVLSESITTIGDGAFHDCSSLMSLLLPESITTIGKNAFRNCSSIQSLSIPGNVLSIGSGSFVGCESLKDVKFCDGYQTLRTAAIPSDCPMVSLYLGRNIYTNFDEFFYFPRNEYYQGFFWSKTLESVTFGKTISSINPLAFTDCDKLKEIYIPSNIKSIGQGAFSDCGSLTSVEIEGPQCDIRWCAFYKCKSLKTVKLNVADIGDDVIFEECSKLSEITLGRDVKTIGRGLDYCSKLQTLYCYAKNPPVTNEYSFWEEYRDSWGRTDYRSYKQRVNLYVPEASISQYKAVEPWKSFKSINALFIPVDSIAFDSHEIKMEKKSSLKINCYFFPDDANNQELEWKSSDNLVVSVNDGKLIANEVGSAYVYAFSKDNPNAKDSCLVNVVVSTNGVTLSHNECVLGIGESKLLEATITPFDASNKKVYWSSSNETVCGVNNGLVTAKAKGTAIIMVTTEDGGYTAKCTFTVNQPVSGITLNSDNITFNSIGESFQLEATVLPEDASNKEVKWSSSNEAICMVSQGKVIATGYGTAVVIASTVDGGFLASCVVKVEDTSAIQETIADSLDDYPIYDLMGCKVEKVIKGGLYIQNGKKFIAR